MSLVVTRGAGLVSTRGAQPSRLPAAPRTACTSRAAVPSASRYTRRDQKHAVLIARAANDEPATSPESGSQRGEGAENKSSGLSARDPASNSGTAHEFRAMAQETTPTSQPAAGPDARSQPESGTKRDESTNQTDEGSKNNEATKDSDVDITNSPESGTRG